MRGTDGGTGIWRLSLEQIDATVSAQLGPGRVTGNEHGPCFSRQISMYLAKHVGGWSMVKIGRFFNGRHQTTVLHAIKKVEQLRMTDESVDALVEVLHRDSQGRSTEAVGSGYATPVGERVHRDDHRASAASTGRTPSGGQSRTVGESRRRSDQTIASTKSPDAVWTIRNAATGCCIRSLLIIYW